MSKKGFITTRLRNLFRDRPRLIPDDKCDFKSEVETTEDSVEDKIEFLKFATKDQKDDIFAATKDTFNFRNRNREEAIKKFPRFLDIDGLVGFIFPVKWSQNINLIFLDII